MAVTPPVRSAQFPRGLPSISAAMKVKVSEGNKMADFQAELIEACDKSDEFCFFWLENPDASFVWRQKKFERFRSPDSEEVFRADFCRFGTPWRKRTKVATSVRQLQGLRMLCKCTAPHKQLRGQHPTLRKPWTLVAQPYPRGFCKVLAAACCFSCGWSQKFNVGACAKCSSLRVGEATNPGPNYRLRREPRGFSLESAPVQTFASIGLADRRWDLFLGWCREHISGDPLELFLRVPLFLAHAVRRFGDLD